jgi:hypothetical protein
MDFLKYNGEPVYKKATALGVVYPITNYGYYP